MAYTTIDDPTKYFDVTLWTGTGGARTITGLNHKPDLIWTKTRSVAYNHMLSDSTRGFNANSEIGANSDAAEGGLSAETYGYKSGHTSDGWTMVDGSDTVDNQEDGNTNQPSVTYVGWTWAANGGTTSSNNDGSYTSTVQANTTAGFSIVKYGDASSFSASSPATVGHGLGKAPKWILIKNLDGTRDWGVHHVSNGAGKIIYLNLTNAVANSTGFDNGTLPSSSVFTVNTLNVANGNNLEYIAYCWAPIQGFSKFGSYKGNGESSGAFSYTGFKPAWIMIKRQDSSTNGDWAIYDNERRNGANENNKFLRANGSNTEASASGIDILSNGFKIRSTSSRHNANDSEYIYMTFAEHPFVTSGGTPVTAT